MHHLAIPLWTAAPFVGLVLAIAVLPLVAHRAWERPVVQVAVVVAAAAPVVLFYALGGHLGALAAPAGAYASFVATLGALYVTAGGVRVTGDLEAKPSTNVAFVVVGAILASLIGTTGASMLLIRPLLETNSERKHTEHIVPFFILAVANAGGMLTPIGDPPLLVGYLQGVPFTWTLRLLPFWALYVGTISLALFLVDRRAHARESVESLALDRSVLVPLAVEGRANLVLLVVAVAAVLLPSPWREVVLVAVAVVSLRTTPRARHQANGFTLGPILEVAILFAGIFACLAPIETLLERAAAGLPLHHPWQLFWASGSLSAVLDNAPTYAAFSALAAGTSHGQPNLVAGVAPLALAAISLGSVVMGATTYIGNGPNLMVKAIAERAGFTMPSFGRYALFAIAMLLPAHLVTTAVLVVLER